MAIAHQPLINPAKLMRHSPHPLRTKKTFGFHHLMKNSGRSSGFTKKYRTPKVQKHVTRAPLSQEQRLVERSRSSRRMDETTVFLSGVMG
jgi:hypothetical protein